jgi:hypothetical protein
MRLTINGGIGDLIHSHAMVEACEHEQIEIGIEHTGVANARSLEYLRFADLLLAALCDEPRYKIVDGDGPGQTPQMLADAGLPIVMPDLRRKLDLPKPCRFRHVVVTTKVRGWDRSKYLAIRDEFLRLLGELPLPIVLVGERQIGWNDEYQCHGPDRIFSIYEDLAPLAAVDKTVPELGRTPPTWRQFLADMSMLADAQRVVTLGTGGNVSMAMSVGWPLVLAGETEMGDYFLAMPPDERVSVFDGAGDYLQGIRGIA